MKDILLTMGAFEINTPRLLCLCYAFLLVCGLFLENCQQVSANSEVDTDLVFDSLDSASSNENHPRIRRAADVDFNSSPPVEEHWLSSTVNRIKRSIGSIFSKDEKISNKVIDDHKRVEHLLMKREQPKKVRKHRQSGGQIAQQEQEGDEFDQGDFDNDNNDVGESYSPDDEDNLEASSGGSGEVTVPEVSPTSTPPGFDYGHPRVYRFTFTVAEPYKREFSDRNSQDFQRFAERLKRSIEDLYQRVQGDQFVTIINIQESGDPFKVKVIADVDSTRNSNAEEIKQTLYEPIETNHRIGDFTATPENFFFREFGESPPKCESDEIQCRSGQCITADKRCNRIADCDDNSDEEGCLIETPLETTITPDITVGRTEVQPELPVIDEGSGDGGCRADDSVRCTDGSRAICADQICDGHPDCDDGGDEKNCPSGPSPTPARECARGEFKCDVSRCIPVSRVCDGSSDCSDGTDEHNCRTECPQDQMRCDEDKCINFGQRCDGLSDCQDGTDEQDCPVPQRPCYQGQFDCGNGYCLPDSIKCNGRSECPDGKDEWNCTTACSEDQFDCGGNVCIALEYLCDSVPDCSNGLDEQNCPVNCSADEFTCVSDGACIPNYLTCDGTSHCADNSDELNCGIIPVKPRCSSNELRCNDGSCIAKYRQCDGYHDCPDGSDEIGCPCRSDQFECFQDRQCIDSNLRCDNHNDCRDGSDEYNCPTVTPSIPTEPTPPQVTCQHGYVPCRSLNQCIPREQLCDGRADCYDISDETNCPGSSDGLNLRTYPDAQEQKEQQEVVFTCRDEGPLRARVHWERQNGLPLPPGATDVRGRLEIPNIQLEHGGTYLCVASGYPLNTPGAQVSVNLRVVKRDPRPTLRPTPACGLYEATCSNGDCIPKNKVCDGIYDCVDGSDENRCNPNGCEPNEFQCNNKKCILKTWRCDSDDDCGDGSDESNCATNPPGSLCQYHQFSCHSNNQCIPKSYHCDMERDCVDGTDEIGCSKPVISQPPPPMVNLNIGETFEITCTAVGIPTPEIVWRKNWGHIPAKCRTTSENGFGKLICENIQEEDQGAYSCEAINIKGATFAVPDTILVIRRERVCPVGYFNTEARSEAECIKCFCFGHTTECRSADLFIFQFQPPFDSLKFLGVHIDPNTGVVDIRDEPIYRGAQPNLVPVGPKGVYAAVPEYSELSQPNVIPYFAMPENYHGNQLKSYGGFLRYTVRHSDRGYPTPGPTIIITGNGYTLLHESSYSPSPNTDENMEVRFFEGNWIIKSVRGPQRTATREEIMMVLEDIDNILIKLQYNEGALNTNLTNIEMDSAAAPNSGLGAAVFVEQCSCPAGYTGNSCERCTDGYVRHEIGPWLGQCYRERRCSPGQYFDGRSCENCPCPQTSPPNQFAQTCRLGSDGDVICDCAPGYVGLRCQSCAPGYEGNPLVTGDYCRPIRPPPPPAYCDPDGSFDPRPDASGRCRCKQLADGPQCNQCKANTFYLNRKTQFGCIPCFCMGVSSQCSSSNWYRDQISTIFTSSSGDFSIVDNLNRDTAIKSGIHLNRESQEITYGGFNSSNAYYWVLPSRYLGDKITSYGGYLRYSIRHKPVPGGERSKNSGVAPDVELVSKNNINLSFSNRNQTQPSSAAQNFVVPLLEQYWERSDGQPADREHLLMVLADLEAIYIKATYFTYTQESSLISVSLDIANERNTGSLERALEVEQCYCPQGYVGLSCEDCDVGYSRTQDGLYLGLCERCNCNGFSNECDPDTGVCRNCRNHTTGDNCDVCLPGYTGDPTSGQPCVRQNIIIPCNCDARGSISDDCTNSGCACKVNVEGYYCDHCRNGTFGLNSNNIEGCETCFCSGVATECTESNLYVEQIPIQIDRENHKFTLTNQYRTSQISDNFNVDVYINQISYTFSQIPRESLYWSLPDLFTGNQIKSYGGKLEFTLSYSQYPTGSYVPDRDVIISGNGLTIYYTSPSESRPNEPRSWSVLLHPSAQWFRLDQATGLRPASREDMLIVLANIDSILIRATQSSETTSVQLSDITLDTAVSQNTRQRTASSVEACRCPPGYRGTSCESCSSGYYKDLYFDQSRPLGSCSRCPCNNREESCELGNDRRIICHCLPGYSGSYCQTETETEQTTPYPTDTTNPPPTIEVSIEDTNIGIYEVGSTVRFNCSARSRISPSVNLRWSKFGGNLPELAIDDGRGLLVITNLRVTDSGRYVCEASDGRSIITSTVDLNVGARQDERPRVVVSQPYVDVDEGQLIEVRCAGMGFPAPELTIIRLDDQPLSPLVDGIFRISQARLSDSGEYECIARNRAGSDAARFTIAVKSLDVYVKVEVEPPYYQGNSGDKVILRCRTTSSSSTTTWSKEGGSLPFDSRSDGGVLTINNVVPEDSGIYICSVTAYSGQTSSARASVTIKGSDVGRYPTATVSPDRVTISQGQSTELYCAANGIPPPSVKWTKLGGELSSNSEQIGSTLFIRNARVEDRGIYVCVATNSHGIEQASVVMEVTRLEVPRLEIYPSVSQTIVAGNSGVLQCRVTAGIPSPTVVWRRGNNLPLSSNVEEMSGNTLRFTSITRNEEGEYICTATNEAGTSSATASLAISTTPEIYVTPNEEIITRNIGAFLRLECQGSGIPQPSVRWNKHEAQIYHDLAAPRTLLPQTQAVQEFNHLTREDSGLYICTAENSAGITEKRIQLVVDTLPSRGDITGEDATSGKPDWKTYPSYDETYSAPIGTRAEIRCSISSQNQNPGIEVKWIRTDNSSLPPDAYERSGTLYIDNVQSSAAGEYRCLGIEQSTGRVLFHLNTYLKVVSPPRITLIPPRQVVHPGDNAYINCSAIGDQPISIFWSPIGRNMPNSVYTRDGYIRFNNIQLQDAGRYLCKARNSAGEAEAVADVIVEDNYPQPPIRAEQKRQNAPMGSNISLRCRAGNPNTRSSIRWFRENLPLPPNSQVSGEVLYIQQVQQPDQGRYYCEIAGKEGTFSDYIDLTISVRQDVCQNGWWLCSNKNCIPKSQLCDSVDDCGDNSDEQDCQQRIRRGPVRPSYTSPTLHITPPESEHHAGENVDIVCQSSERGAITAWSKLSGWLSDNVQSSGGTLRIFNLRAENNGIYRCEATGQQGVYHKDYNLTVIDDEYRDQPPVRIKRAPRGKSVRLECNTNLEEPITYLWTKQGGNLPSNADLYSKAIELNDLNNNDAGTYTCSASSGITNLNVPIILVVTGIIPYFTQAPNSYITLPTLGDSYMQFSFEISFKPENGNGLILYNGNRGDRSGDFISLSLVNFVPEFKFNLGFSVTTVRATHPISNGQWHTVKIVRNKKKSTMYVDADGPFVETADGKYIGLDLTEPLYLGGVPDSTVLAPEVFPNSPYVGFVGCISRFKIGHVHWDVLGEALNKTGVTTCETCADSKCENQGACQEALSKEGYSCICPSGFSGPTCNKLKGEACSPYACGVGRCIDNENGFECLCPLGKSGRRCEREITINEPAFQNDAYIAYPTPKPSRVLKLTLKIKPNDLEDGVLFYCGETEEGHGDFLSLAIRNKHLEFRFDAGNGVTVIKQNEELIPGEWHILTATKSLSNGRLTIDGKASTGRVSGNHKTLNLHTPLYVGGYDKHNIKLNDGVQVYSGFNGCISDINVSGIDLDIIQNATDSSNIQDCSDESDIDNNIIEYESQNNVRAVPYDSRQTGCSSNPCQNNGQCYPLTPTDYQCSCLRGYTGKSCEIPVAICGHQPCQNRGLCKGNNTHYSCDCLLGYTGYNCDQRTELHNDAHFEGDGYLEFSRNLLSHDNDLEPELIALELSTNSSNGLIFWHGQRPNEDGQGQDYVALAMENGYLEYSFDLGMGPAIIANRNKRLDDGEQHTVILKRKGKTGSMEIDNGIHYDEGEAEGEETTMNCYGNIYVGGTPDIKRMTGGRFAQGFKGCIHGFEVQNSHRLDLGLRAINGLNIKPCSRSWEAFNSISREPIH